MGALAWSIWYILPQLETGFLPEMDEGSIVMDYTSPPGTSLQETDRMLREVEKGPFTEEQLRELLASSHLTPQTLCRLETESVWRILAKTIRLTATEA